MALDENTAASLAQAYERGDFEQVNNISAEASSEVIDGFGFVVQTFGCE